jgi:hypothetical protein
VFPAVGECDPGACNEVSYGRGNKNFSGVRKSSDPRADVHGDAADVAVVAQFELASVNTGADLDTETSHRGSNRSGAFDCAGRTVERGEHAVARCLDLTSAVAIDLPAREVVVGVEQHLPGAVAQRYGGLG